MSDLSHIHLSHIHLSGDEPWPGLAWFEEVDQPFFRGRAAETAELIRLVRREALTVLFGRSGLGKTSLLKAGLFPALRAEDFLPVYIRLDHAAEAPSLRQQVWQALASAVEIEGVQGSRPLPEEELWAFLHRRDAEFWSKLNRPVTPVIVFDQFEEIFTLGQQEESQRQRSERFLDELGDLVENRPPAAVKQQLEQEPEAAGRYEFRRATAKLVFSFREDFLAEIERLKSAMPSLMVNRLRLLPMNGTQAYAVVTEAGGRLVDDEVARRLLQLTWKNAPDPPADPAEFPQMEIDPALLSVVCRELNSKRREEDPPLEQINTELMAGADREILKGFYERGMEGLDPGVRTFVEEELITQQGYRDSHDWEDALMLPGVTTEAMDVLIARRLLRGEERQGRRRLELTHDVLAKVVQDSRDSRRAREAEAAQANEALAIAERERAAETARRLRTTRRLLRVSGVLGACLVLVGGVAMWQSIRARQLAEKVSVQAEQNAKKAQWQARLLTLAWKQADLEKEKAESLAKERTKALKVAAEGEQQAIEARKQAEKQRVEANTQRMIAEQKQKVANSQRLIAERQTRIATDALRQAREEKSRADSLQQKLSIYEGRQDLGNSQLGDGLKYRGRGYIMTVGRSNYAHYGLKTGVDLEDFPEKAADPDVAAQILVIYLQEQDIASRLDSSGLPSAYQAFNRINPSKKVLEKYSAYLAAVRQDGAVSYKRLPVAINPDWHTVHVRAILNALKKAGVSDRATIAFSLLIADDATSQGRFMVEKDDSSFDNAN